LLDSVTVDGDVLRQLDAQPEFRLPVWDYVAVMADQERVDDGVSAMRAQRAVLDGVVARYRVDAETLAALWGVESNFGRGTGAFPVLRSLATLGCRGRRQGYFRNELFAALRIVQRGDILPAEFRGSWAGAFGQTQFMPGAFEGRAVDFDGDGRRDLIGNAGDALASAANYLRAAGWIPGLPWGVEVRLPPSVDPRADGGRRATRTLEVWRARGVTRVDGRALDTWGPALATRAALFAPAGRTGPVFLVTRNFVAIFRYNASESYTLAIAHLSDRLRGSGALVTAWPTDDPGLSRADRRELQTLLQRRGHTIGTVDGLLTPLTKTAIRAEQARLGEPVTGRPGQKLLRTLRASASPR
jgi:lytic murein transglycosylase